LISYSKGRSRILRLADCDVHGPGSGAELFIVEGDSASIAATQARNARCQAVLPMQGKPLNAVRAPDRKVAGDPFYRALTESLGTGWGDAFDPGKLRYERVVLLTDPDADGIHCGALLLMFFYRWMQPLLDAGRLGVVHAPMGEILREGDTAPVLAFSDAQFQSICAALRNSGRPEFKAMRYRGLGSLDRDALQMHCMAPATRNLRWLTSADALAALEVFGSLRDLPPQLTLL